MNFCTEVCSTERPVPVELPCPYVVSVHDRSEQTSRDCGHFLLKTALDISSISSASEKLLLTHMDSNELNSRESSDCPSVSSDSRKMTSVGWGGPVIF